MMAYRKLPGGTYYLNLATGDPKRPYVRPTSGTRDKPTADQMQAMLDLVGARGKRWHWIRDAIVAKRLKVAVLFDHYVAGTLDELRDMLSDVDLRPLVTAWEQELERSVRDGTLAAETVRKYKEQVRVLVGVKEPVWRSLVTAPALKAALDEVKGSGTNRRRHAAAWTSLFDYCVEHGKLEANPLRTMKLPKSNKHRERYAEWPVAMRLIQAMPAGMHRALAAIRHGAGLEMTAALAMHRRDVVDVDERIVWAHGTKNTNRDRQAPCLDEECWRIFWDYVSSGGFLPDARLFPITSRVHGDAQEAAHAALVAKGVPIRTPYRLHDSRSTYAVEMLRRGFDPKLIAQSGLGHANERLLLTHYGKYRQTTADIVASKRRQAGAR